MAQCSLSPRTHGYARFFLLTVGLAVSGLVSALLLVLAVSLLVHTDSAGFGALGLALGGAMLGYPLGVMSGLYLLRRLLRLVGSLPLGIAGALVGAAVPVAIAAITNAALGPDVLIVAYFISVPVLCSLGFGVRGIAVALSVKKKR